MSKDLIIIWIISAIVIVLITINYFDKRLEETTIEKNKAEIEYIKIATEKMKKK